MTDRPRTPRILSPDDRARLARRLAGRRPAATEPPIPRRSADATRLPLSFAQEPLWFLGALDRAAVTGYGVTMIVPLQARRGNAAPLNVEALRQSLQLIVDRHESLRTVFAADREGPHQVVLPPVPVSLTLVDLTAVDAARLEDRVRDARRAEAECPFDLKTGPLFRARLLQMPGDRHELVLAFHHIIADGWAIGVFVRELAAAYDALARARTPSLPDLAIQYPDYALWQRTALDGDTWDRHIAYWTDQLAGAPIVELPADRPRPALPTFRGATEHVAVPPAIVDGLTRVGRETQATLFMVLLAAFKALLAHSTGHADLIVGTPIANRGRAELDGMVGFCANMIALRTRLRFDETCTDLVRRVRDVCLGAYDHQQMPFERLVETLAPERDPSRNPLFQIGFNVLEGGGEPPAGGGLTFGPLAGVSETTRFDLEVHVSHTTAGLDVGVLYARDLFDAATIRQLAERYARVLEVFAGAPDSRLDAVDLLDATERTQLVAGGRGVVSGYPDETLGAAFLRTAAAHADRVAIEEDGRRSTYRDVAASAARLARVLRAEGVGPNVAVGVWLERNATLLETIVGIALAGGAYVPIEPTQPAERAAAMFADAGVSLVVSSEQGRATVPAGPWSVVTLESIADVPSETAIASCGHVDDLAYVLFTSGSTGRPKGVAVPQRAVMRLVSRPDYVSLGPDTVIGQAATAAFDAATFEIWGALLHGGRLVIVPTSVAVSPAALGAYLRRTGVTTLFLTTALVHQIGREAPAALLGIEILLFGGEAVEPRWIAAIQAAGGPSRIVHVYGPTEATTFATWYPIESAGADADTIPIGGPIVDTDTWVLGAGGTLAPIGVAGDLYLGGPGLAHGYVGQARLTAEKFVPDGISGAVGARLYRTGDSARWKAPGALTFLGRRDGQVKLRGYRIEMGEVEGALARVPGVGAAAAIVIGEGESRRIIGCVSPAPSAKLDARAVREAVKERLPGYMVPASIVVLPALPLNAHGKVDRAALRRMKIDVAERPADSSVQTPQGLEGIVAGVWREVLGVDVVSTADNFFDLGGHSLLLVRVQAGLEAALGRSVPLVALFRHPTVSALAAHLEGRDEAAKPVAASVPAPAPRTDDAIAIIGMAGRFPGAPDVDAFWELLKNGVEGIRHFSVDELKAAGVSEALLADPHYVGARGIVDGIEQFDAGLFGYAPRDAALLDPQQRLMLECAWEALERAGHAPGAPSTLRVGVYAGTSANTYLASAGADAVAGTSPLAMLVASDKDFLATRVSYKLQLTGPAVTVQTACSTSLVAVHTACQALRAGECDMALAGGVSITLPAIAGYRHHADGIVSPDGHCRAFDAAAAGTVAGQGVGVVVLKPLRAAVADGDEIHAVIRGSAINNDGAAKVGFTAPSVGGQAAAIRAAHAAAGVTPDTITYVEAHGTGTTLGDPIEIAALKDVWGESAPAGSCALGSVKTNVGHLDAAAGVTGLIKTVLALQHKTLPPSLHFQTPTPQVEFGPFWVPNEATAWTVMPGQVRRAGVSAFGMGGTNAHVIVEEAPERAASEAGRRWHVLPVSGQTAPAVEQATGALASYLDARADAPIADVVYTQQVGRVAMGVRAAAVGRDAASLSTALKTLTPSAVGGAARPCVWLFPGQGTQTLQMGRALYESEPVFRAELEACALVVSDAMGVDLLAVLYPEAGAEEDASRRLGETAWTQVAIVSVELALAALWRSWGLAPAALVGHSVGEIAAASVAGVLTREDAIRLTAARGRLMGLAPAGGMLAVAASAADVERWLLVPGPVPGPVPGLVPGPVPGPVPGLVPGPGAEGRGGDLWVAAVNSPSQSVIAGSEAALARAARALSDAGVAHQRLAAAGAFHSGLMADVVVPLTRHAAVLDLRAPSIPWISTVTGSVMTADEARDPGYWGRQVTSPVRWADAMTTARGRVGTAPVWLEVGPGRTLIGLTRAGAASDEIGIASLGSGDADESWARALAGLWTAGVAVDWAAGHAGTRRHRVTLPTYPFQRQRYWLESSRATPPATGSTTKDADRSRWIFEPCWRQTPLAGAPRTTASHCLVLTDAPDAEDRLSAALAARGATITRVSAGAHWQKIADDAYVIDRADRAHYTRLVESLAQDDRRPSLAVIATLSADAAGPADTPERADTPDPDAHRQRPGRELYDLLYLTQALAAADASRETEIVVLTRDAEVVRGDEAIVPSKAATVALARVIPQEWPAFRCRVVDLDRQASTAASTLRLADEVLSSGSEPIVAFRGGRRWVQTFERMPAAADDGPPVWRANGTYVITGGLGRVGLAIARHAARVAQATLILVSRSGVPQPDEWDAHLASASTPRDLKRRIEGLRDIHTLGGRAIIVECDVADGERLCAAIEAAERTAGPVRGIVHAAGATSDHDFAALATLDRQGVDVQFVSKVDGARVVARLAESRDLDFCILASSLAAVLGGIGFGAYAAANAVLNACAMAANRSGAVWTSIMWDGWRFGDTPIDGTQGTLTSLAMTEAEGLDVLDRILRLGHRGALAVSTVDINERLARLTREGREARGGADTRHERSARPEIATPYVEPHTDTEIAIAEAWRDALGIARLGADDNFFELGGHSLMAVHLLARLSSTLDVSLSLKDLWEAPTVAGLAAAADRLRDARSAGAAGLAQALDALDSLSTDELNRLLKD